MVCRTSHGILFRYKLQRTGHALWYEEKGYAYDGYNYGGGLTLGYQFYLSPHWNLELSAGAGYLPSIKYYVGTGGLVGHYKNYGPTCAAIGFYLYHQLITLES